MFIKYKNSNILNVNFVGVHVADAIEKSITVFTCD